MPETAAPAPVDVDLMHRSPVTGCLHYGSRAACALSACVAARAIPVVPAHAVPPVVADYFTRWSEQFGDTVSPLAVTALFVPGRGWFSLPLAQRVEPTLAWAQGAQAAGARAVRIGAPNGVHVDFQLAELV